MRLASFLSLLSLPLALAAAPTPPVQELAEVFMPPTLSQARLSPDGRHLAYVVRDGDRYGLGIYNLASKQEKLISDPKIWPLAFWWKTADRLLVRSTSYDVDAIGYSSFDVKGENLEDLHQLLSQHGLVANGLPEEPRKVILTDALEVKKADIETGKAEKLAGDIHFVNGWLLDARGGARAALRSDPKHGSVLVWWRPAASGEWRSREFAPDEVRFLPVALAADDRNVWGWKIGADSEAALALLDTTTGKYEPKVFAAGREPNRLLMTGPVNRPLAIAYTKTAGAELFALEERDRPAVATLQDKLSSYWPEVTDISPDGKFWIVRVENSRTPGTYVFFDPVKGAVMPFSRTFTAKMPVAAFVAAEPFSFLGRGGHTLSGVLWRPKGVERPPVVVFCPRGMPVSAVRDTFDPEVQALVLQGYAVLQTNVRGTLGFGPATRNEIEGRWGTAVREDLEDALDAVAKRGQVDPTRAFVYGREFGAAFAILIAKESKRFAAMAAVDTDPEMHRQDLLRASKNDSFVSLVAHLGWSQMGKIAAALSPERNIPGVQIPAIYLNPEDSWRGHPAEYGRRIWTAAKKSKAPSETGLSLRWFEKVVPPTADAIDEGGISLRIGRFFAAAPPLPVVESGR